MNLPKLRGLGIENLRTWLATVVEFSLVATADFIVQVMSKRGMSKREVFHNNNREVERAKIVVRQTKTISYLRRIFLLS